MKRFEKKIFWSIIGFGLALPWIIGTGVKLYLQIQGKPTWPWAFFFQPHILIMSLICTVWFATPYIGLAFLARFILSRQSFFRTGYSERLIIILGGFLCGSVAAVKIFLEVFIVFDPMIFLAVSLPASYATYMLIGLLGGSLVTTAMVLLRKPTTLPNFSSTENLFAHEVPKFNLGKSLTEQELRAFIGKGADYYLKKWQPILGGQGRRRAGFNWAAFFLPGLWFPYRKMHKAAFIFYGISLIETILEEVLFVGILGKPESPFVLDFLYTIVVGIVCGAFGNIWYLSHTRKVTDEVRSKGLQEEAYFELLSKRGGTNLKKSLGFFILFLLIALVATLIVGTAIKLFPLTGLLFCPH